MENTIWWVFTILKGCITGNPVAFLQEIAHDNLDVFRDRILGMIPPDISSILDEKMLESLAIPKKIHEMVRCNVEHILARINDPTKYGYDPMVAAENFFKEYCPVDQYNDREKRWILLGLCNTVKYVLLQLQKDGDFWLEKMNDFNQVIKTISSHDTQIKIIQKELESQEVTVSSLLEAVKIHCEKQISLAQHSTLTIENIESTLYPNILDDNRMFEASENQTALLQKIKCMDTSSVIYKGTRNLLLIGEGGIGKTVAMLGTCRYLIEQGKISLYIPLRRMNQEGSSISHYIFQDVFYSDKKMLSFYRSILLEKNEQYKSKRIYLFLDGLNELNQENRQFIWNEIRELSYELNSQLIVASRRPPEAERLYNLSFQRLDMLRLPWEKVTRYLELHSIAIPDIQTMGDILGVPLMLKAYTYIKCQVQDLHILMDPFMAWKNTMNNSNELLWNYVQCQIYQAFQHDNSYDFEDYIIAGEYMAPFLASKMNARGVYTAEESAICQWLDCGLEHLFSSKPDRIKRISRHYRRHHTGQLDGNNIFHILLYKLNILACSEDGHVSFKHQEFQDVLHFIYLENSLTTPGEPFYENAYTSHKLPYDVLTLMSQRFSEEIISDLFQRIKLAPGEHGIYNLIEIFKRIRNYDLSDVNLSDLDLTGVNFQNTKLSNQVTGKKTLLRNTIIGSNTFSSLGHSAAVTSISSSPSGGKLVSGSYDNTLKIWNAETGEYLNTLEGHTHYVRCVAWAPTVDLIASGGDDSVLRIWSLQGDSSRHVLLEGHAGWIYSVAWNRDSTRLISGDSLGEIILWEYSNGQWHRAINNLPRCNQRINCIAWSSTEQCLVAVGTKNGTLLLYNIQTCESIYLLFPENICGLAWSPDGVYLAVASEDTIYICSTNLLKSTTTGTCIDSIQASCFAVLKGPTTTISSIVWFARGLAEAKDRTIRIWDIQKILRQKVSSKTFIWDENLPVCLEALENHADHINSLICLPSAPNENTLISCSDDCTLRIWKSRSPSWNVSWNCVRVLGGEQTPVRCTAWSPDGNLLAAGYDDCMIRIWDVSKSRCIRVLHGHTSRIKCLVWSQDGQLLASGSNDKTVRIWDVDAGKCQETMTKHVGAINCILWLKDTPWIVTGSDDNTILLWNTENQIFKELVGHTDSVYSIAFSPDGTMLLSGSNDKYLRIWKLNFDDNAIPLISPSISWQAHEKPIRCVAWLPHADTDMIISGSNDCLLKRWRTDGTPWDQAPELSGHSDFVYCCAGSPDGKYIVSGSTDKTLQIWDVYSGKALLELTEHTSFIWNVAWGKGCFSSASSDGTIRIWSARDISQISMQQVLQAFSGVDFVGCDFSCAKFETEKLYKQVKMNGGFFDQ